MLLKNLTRNLILIGICIIGINTDEFVNNGINSNKLENNEEIKPIIKFDATALPILPILELFPNLLNRFERNSDVNDISNTLHSLYSEERDSCVGYDIIHGNRVKRNHKCSDNCPFKKLESNQHDLESINKKINNKRIKRNNCKGSCSKNKFEIERVRRQICPKCDKFESIESNIDINYDGKDRVKREKLDETKTNLEFNKDLESDGYDLENLETINKLQIELNPEENSNKIKCLEKCVNLNNVDFNNENDFILKSENLEQNKTESRLKREEDCDSCLIGNLMKLGSKLKESNKKSKNKCTRSKCSNKKCLKGKSFNRNCHCKHLKSKSKSKACRKFKNRKC